MSKFFFIVLAFFVSSSHADTITTYVNGSTTPTSTTTGGVTTTPTTAATTTAASGTSAAATGTNSNPVSSSNSSKSLALIGDAVTGGVGAYMGYQCATTSPTNWMACVMAAQCAMQLVQSMQSQNAAGNVASAYTPDTTGLGTTYGTGDPASSTLTGSTGTGDPGTSTGTATSPNASGLAALAAINGSLAKVGVSTDPATGAITLPNGTTVPGNSTPSSLKASGFNAGQVDQTVADAKKLEASLLAKNGGVPALSFDGGSGGRSITANAFNPNAVDDFSTSKNGLGGRRPGSVKSSVAGLSRKLGDENIGVKGDNIFEMVNRRYRDQAKQNNFILDK